MVLVLFCGAGVSFVSQVRDAVKVFFQDNDGKGTVGTLRNLNSILSFLSGGVRLMSGAGYCTCVGDQISREVATSAKLPLLIIAVQPHLLRSRASGRHHHRSYRPAS